MTTMTPLQTDPLAGVAPRLELERVKLTGGVATVLAAGVGNQIGAAVGVLAFPVLGPAGVVAIRQLVAAVVLLPIARPRVREMGRDQWIPVIVLAAVLSVRFITLYSAVERIGLGLAVTLEFVGPLAVALLSSRRAKDIAIALAAVVGVVVLVNPGTTTDILGVMLALTAAACWAGYILLNRVLGTRFTGLEGPALASGIAAVLYFPVLIHTLTTVEVTAFALAAAACTGLFASVIPYATDLRVLRLVPAKTFGVLMSVHPALAAVAGLLILSQTLSLYEAVGIAIVIAANVAAVRSR